MRIFACFAAVLVGVLFVILKAVKKRYSIRHSKPIHGKILNHGVTPGFGILCRNILFGKLFVWCADTNFGILLKRQEKNCRNELFGSVNSVLCK